MWCWYIISGSSCRSFFLFHLLACWLLTTDLSRLSLEGIWTGMPDIWSEEVPSSTKMACADQCDDSAVCLAKPAWIVTYEVLHTKTTFDGSLIVMKIMFQCLLWALWGQYGIIPISNSKQIIEWPSPLLPLLSNFCSTAEHTHSNSCHTLVDTTRTVKIMGNICGHVTNKHILMPYRNTFLIPFGSIVPVVYISGCSLVVE